MSRANEMQRRRIGRSDVELSVVGFGTCQLRLVPEEQAMTALARGFELGVDWVHVSPDYGGAETLVEQAVRRSGKEVLILGDGSGSMDHFQRCWERTQRLNGPGPVPMWGISCIDDQEFVGNNVWGAGGMVEFLLEKKRSGELRATYCTTHAPAEQVVELVECGVFDAIMLAWNPLGFHVLSSYAAAEGKRYEDHARTRQLVFPLAEQRGVSLLVMKALAGGLLTRSRAFPPRALLAEERTELRATDVLRHVLAQKSVAAVVPGTAIEAEAIENALAGHGPIEPHPERDARLQDLVASMRLSMCSRCGACESTCSKGLPISWLFQDAYIWLNPGDTFDAVPRLGYFHLQPEAQLACATCDDRTCLCPQGLDVPVQLGSVHTEMLRLRRAGVLPLTPEELEDAHIGDDPRVVLVQRDLPASLAPGERARALLWVENSGHAPWLHEGPEETRTWLELRHGGRVASRVSLREETHPGVRTHFVLELEGPHDPTATLELVLMRGPQRSTLLATIPRGSS